MADDSLALALEMLSDAEAHLGGYMGERFAEVEGLRQRIREFLRQHGAEE